jgi:nucleoside-diphosphate-sugar epimerase
VAQAFRLAVENASIVHDVFAINAEDTCSFTPSAELVARHYPRVELTARLDGFATLVSIEKAKRLLGYKPEFSWRRSDFQAWLEDKGFQPRKALT